MARFPRTELETLRLAHDIASGVAAHPELFPAPPSGPDQGLQLIETYYQARDTVVAQTATTREVSAVQRQAIRQIADWAKSQIHYAEALFRRDPAKLALIGWGGRRSRTVMPETLPGQPGHLVVQHEGKTSVSLSWRDPVDGGEVAAYKIQRRKTGGDWTDVGTAVSSEITLNSQDSGVEQEYQVIAVNKTGDGPASNVVRVVL